MRVGIVAGEASGDNLAGSLIEALRKRRPELEVFGVAGPRMRAAGCSSWADADELAVMGIAEVLGHLPRLLKLRRELTARFLKARPDVFVGVDAPDFNLGLEQRLRQGGIKTVHYVSPSVWAWRRGRMQKIRAATDCVLCLLPFEQAFYAAENHPAVFVGHPLADQVPMDCPQGPARQALALPLNAPVLAVLPGSRRGEVQRIGPVFAATIAQLAGRHPRLEFIAPFANPATREMFAAQLREHAPGVAVQMSEGNAQLAMTAANAVLLASGTAVLEALLIGRPHVVAYKIAPSTAQLVRLFRLMHTEFYALTNLLAGTELVPEFLQEAATPRALATAVEAQLYDTGLAARLTDRFRELHRSLRRQASERAADAIIELAGHA